MDFYRLSIDEIFARLGVTPTGLSSAAVKARLDLHGTNELETKTAINPLVIFVNQFKSFIIYILLFATIFSLLIGEYVDTVIILAILIANAVIGFFQELGAHRSLEALKMISTVRATVLRDGKLRTVEAKNLVPGDIVELDAGDKVPADLRIIEAVRLKAEESALTGESVPTEKNSLLITEEVSLGDRRNMLFSATSIATGHARAIVVNTGMQTELGRITTLIREAVEEMTPLQRRLDRFGKKLGYAIIVICAIVFVLCFAKAYWSATLTVDAVVAFAFIAISLAVAAVPTALPAVVTIALSIGVKRLLAKKALVRNLSSVETLGSCDVICTDKTGTLTENQMTVRQAWTLDSEMTFSGTGYAPVGDVSGAVAPELLRCGLLCNNASLFEENGWQIAGDPTEVALLTSAAKAGIRSEAHRRDEIPFDSERKLMSVRCSAPEGETIYSKGALDKILARCKRIQQGDSEIPLTAEQVAIIERQNALYASRSMRVLAFAKKSLAATDDFREDDLCFLGLQAMIDPPRPDVVAAIAKTSQAGIRVVMITGDYGETARAIGREVGIQGGLLTGADVEQMDDAALQLALEEGTNIFSRVAPEHKYRIVDMLQRMGHTVAMTGDGVNDAPALKKANIGVAVGSGTAVAKDAADFVLLDDSFSHIVNAIEEGRGIYDNIQKSIMLLLSGNLGEVLIIFLAVLFGMNLPLTAILLLWINMVTDGAPALAYSVDPYGRDIMQRQPKPRAEGILPRPKLVLLGVLGSVGTALALTLFQAFGGNSDSAVELLRAQTMVFNFVVLYEVVLIFVIRSDYQVPFLANKWVWAAAVLSVVLQAILMYTPLAGVFKIIPLSPSDVSILLGSGLLFMLIAMIYQWVMRRVLQQPAP
ncbi:MAG: cation-translocating P-type ATPase [Desulfuromonadales bacterium]|nr:cation-translocating P-type ATPase [Desulfuromonadales bacterium]